ncbi:hypothetical protein C8Q72DRAFT_955408 [Fomitopsis betulina]|nr:hypothetical protein C8Q72DRAFT_955408 [Fomitopsis betulina]
MCSIHKSSPALCLPIADEYLRPCSLPAVLQSLLLFQDSLTTVAVPVALLDFLDDTYSFIPRCASRRCSLWPSPPPPRPLPTPGLIRATTRGPASRHGIRLLLVLSLLLVAVLSMDITRTPAKE